jgi:hypothetical protein
MRVSSTLTEELTLA